MFLYSLSGLLLGLAGSLHCLGMCGPLVMGMPFRQVRKGRKNRAIVIYLLCKALAYGCLGAVMGLVGKGFWQLSWQQYLSVMAGLVICLMAFLPTISTYIKWPPRMQRGFATIYEKTLRDPTVYSFGLLGFMNGLLPCGMVYTALVAATVTNNARYGFFFMVCFGVGTAPALLSLAFLKAKFRGNHQSFPRKIAFALSVCLGLLLIVRGFSGPAPVGTHLGAGAVVSCGIPGNSK